MPLPSGATADVAPGSAQDGPAADPGTSDDVVVTARRRATPGDPLEKINATSFELTQDVDRAIVGPVALAYARTVPTPVRIGMRNALSNLAEPVIALNFMLQLKPKSAARTLGRFAINSTIGVVGLVDVAKRPAFGLPQRPNGFAYTLGYYGIKPGAFLFLPLIGPTTVRDLIGGGIDRLFLPTAVGVPFSHPAYSASTGTVSSLDRRAEIDDRLRELREKNDDPYAALRTQYLLRRQAVIDGLRDTGRRPAPETTELPSGDRPTGHSTAGSDTDPAEDSSSTN